MLDFSNQAIHQYWTFAQNATVVAEIYAWLVARPFSWFFLAISLAAPLLVIFSRNEARVRRLKNLQDFIEAYPSADRARKDCKSDMIDQRDPSLEFVKSKYMADAHIPKKYQAAFDKGNSRDQIQILIRNSRAIGNVGDLKLFIASFGFVALSYFGFSILYRAMDLGLRSGAVEASNACDKAINENQLIVIAALAFTGGYIASIRAFLRGLAIFDLSAYTFLRQTVELFASVALIVFAYKAVPHPFQSVANTLLDTTSVVKCAEISWYWYALAPVLALLPESSSNFLFTRVQTILTWIKRDDDRFQTSTRIIPLDVIEGIDYFIRFRLEECGINDVQNLATFNPILLSVETPFNIYQCVDWIGQAQLCHIIGLDRFLLFREMHIRTIFDLERALDFKEYEDEDDGENSKNGMRARGEHSSHRRMVRKSPDEFDEIYAGILFASTDTMRDVARVSGVQPLIKQGNVFVRSEVDAYCLWARTHIDGNGKTKACVEHLMGWISDDLHVRRLRRIWQEMSDNLGKRSERLDTPAPETCRKACEDEGGKDETTAKAAEPPVQDNATDTPAPDNPEPDPAR